MQRILFSLAFVLPLLMRGGWKESVFAALLLALAAAALSDKRELLEALRSPMRLALLALAAVMLASLLWTRAPLAFSLSLSLAPVWLALWSALASMQRGQFLLWLLICTASFQATVGIFAMLFETRPFADQIGGRWVASGTVQYPLALIAITSSALPFALREAIGGQGKQRAFSIILMVPLLLGLLLAGERLALLVLLLLLASLLLWPGVFSATRREGAVFALLSVPLVAISTWLLRPSFESERYSGLLHGRELIWQKALHLVAERPWGWGPGSWDLVSGQKVLFAHSAPLEAAFSSGLLAGALALLVVFLWLREGRAHWRLLFSTLACGALLYMFDWAWALPAVAGSFLLATILASKEQSTYNSGDA